MDLYKDILLDILSERQIDRIFSDSENNIQFTVEMKCYETLKKIKTIIEDDTYNDAECFTQIEQIIREFEKIGSTCGGRHDFSKTV